jgi:hypothetical protein
VPTLVPGSVAGKLNASILTDSLRRDVVLPPYA